jgi:hypothetical protein
VGGVVGVEGIGVGLGTHSARSVQLKENDGGRCKRQNYGKRRNEGEEIQMGWL